MVISAPADEKARWRLEGILASCRTLEYLIENMRFATALEEGKFELTGSGGGINAILRRAADGLARAFESKQSRLRVFPDDIHISRGAALIELIAANLLLAALNTSAENADVGIGCLRAGGQIRIFVSGDGVAGPGPGSCVTLVAEAARNLGGSAEIGDGRLVISIPEYALV